MSNAAKAAAARKPLPIIVGAASETGLREENQDHMSGFPSSFGAVYLIADGMGGHQGGAEASRMVVNGLQAQLLATQADVSLRQAIDEAARLTNREVFQKGSSGDPSYAGMGSTLALIVISHRESGIELITAHAGDSRVYLQRDGRLSRLTKDHTRVQRLVDLNVIDEESARTHPEASILTRAMGQGADVTIDISEPIPLMDGDGILLCSDGLSSYVARARIEEAVRQAAGPAECAKALVELALKSGSQDNITVQFIRLGNGSVAQSRGALDEQPRDTKRFRLLYLPLFWAALGLAVLLFGALVYMYRQTVFRSGATPTNSAAEQKRRKGRSKHPARNETELELKVSPTGATISTQPQPR